MSFLYGRAVSTEVSSAEEKESFTLLFGHEGSALQRMTMGPAATRAKGKTLNLMGRRML